MEKQPPRPMTPFDELTIPPQFQMLKLMLPYTPVSMQPMLAVFLKFMELQNTVRLFSGAKPPAFSTRKAPCDQSSYGQGFSADMLEEILPYLSPQESSAFENIRGMMEMMEMLQMMQAMQGELAPEESQSPGSPENGQNNTPKKEPSKSGQSGNFKGGTFPFEAWLSGGSNGAGPMNLMMSMLTPEQKELFQTYQNIFETEGEDSHGRMDEQPKTE